MRKPTESLMNQESGHLFEHEHLAGHISIKVSRTFYNPAEKAFKTREIRKITVNETE